ncbi:MAG: bifunctional diaminohydroxyphosphoribosylaminopyrimidine deaminase/5-amino-6-(5-phosphoribosylamino)uracil reductase RibD [Paludibacteraceae bacterium]
MIQDEAYMARCIYLAKLGMNHVAPNPMVGAVVVYDDTIIGEGFHRCYGDAHAEPNAIRSVKNPELLSESTLYVNLEPCSHYGKTPPCANLIVSKGIKRVVIGSLDPNPKVAGKGISILKDAGVQVDLGILGAESRSLNRRFYCYQDKKRPYIILKWAQTANGFLDVKRVDNSTNALKISNAVTTQLTHKMRAENMAIMVGTNTALLDNPSLTVRHWHGKNPIRVIIDKKNKIPEDFTVKDGKVRTLIFGEVSRRTSGSSEFIHLDESEDGLAFMINEMYKRGIHSVLVEGGATLLNSFIRANLWDEANVEVSSVTIDDGIVAPTIDEEFVYSSQMIENHRWKHYYNKI